MMVFSGLRCLHHLINFNAGSVSNSFVSGAGLLFEGFGVDMRARAISANTHDGLQQFLETIQSSECTENKET